MHGKAKATASGSHQRAASGKAQSGLEAALQCEEHLADDASASPGMRQTMIQLTVIPIAMQLSN